MKPKSLLVASLVLVALVAYVYFVEIPREKGDEAREEEESKALALDWENVDRIEIQRFKEHILIRKQDGRWRVEDPVKDEADAYAVDELIRDYENLTVNRRLEVEEGRLAEFDLVNPDFKVTLATPTAERILFLGSDNPVDGSRYAMVDNSKDVLIVPATAFQSASKNLMTLRNKRVFPDLDREALDDIEVYRDGMTNLRLKKSGDGWRIVSPVDAPADPAEVDRVVNSLAYLNIAVFFDESPRGLGQYGLARARMAVALRGQGKAWPTLFIGNAKDDGSQVYAMREGKDPVVLIPADTVDRAAPPVFALRDKRIVPEPVEDAKHLEIAYLQEPMSTVIMDSLDGHWAAAAGSPAPDPEKVKGVLRSIADLRAAAFPEEGTPATGRGAPRVRIEIGRGEGQEPIRLTVYGQAGEGRVLAARDPEGPLAEIDASFVEGLPRSAADLEPEPETEPAAETTNPTGDPSPDAQ